MTPVKKRPGSTITRQLILSAAQQEFADNGYDRATIRSIALAAKVDPALVVHYFGTKQQLFIECMLAIHDPGAGLLDALAGDLDTVGFRFAAHALAILEHPVRQRVILGLIRAAVSEPTAAALLRKLFIARMARAMAKVIPAPDALLRANFVGSQLIGFAAARYIVKVEPLASASKEEIITFLGPTFQRYITGDAG